MSVLQLVNNPEDLKKIDLSKLTQMCRETRDLLISTILENGGHFAGNLGVVELSVALHYVFNSPSDKIIWDVGHQSYIHKILTGRKNLLHSIRNFNGISGFPKLGENVHDAFGTGHSSTAISAACGIAMAFKLSGQSDRKTIAIVGDGALTGGMSFEALNNLAQTSANILVIVNDNHIGIDPNNGALDEHLQQIESSKSNFFQNLGLDYSGPLDGHNVVDLVAALRSLQHVQTPHILHIRTVKGKGYAPAEAEQTKWHSTNRFVKIDTQKPTSVTKWQDIFAQCLDELAGNNDKVVGITPAMPSGSGMIQLMSKYPERFFDVGIAEQHAVTFAAGLATQGFIPYLNIYSTFLQRGYDQLIHDVALQKLPVVFCIDRAGLVGEDGPTHHGVFDISYLRAIPEIVISAPRDESEFRSLLRIASTEGKPFAIRYPKGEIQTDTGKGNIISGKDPYRAFPLLTGEKIAILGTGIASNFALKAQEISGLPISVFHFPFIKPLDGIALKEIFSKYQRVITVEDGSVEGGFGEGIAARALDFQYKGKLLSLGVPDRFIPHGDNNSLYELCGYSPEKIAARITDIYRT